MFWWKSKTLLMSWCEMINSKLHLGKCYRSYPICATSTVVPIASHFKQNIKQFVERKKISQWSKKFIVIRNNNKVGPTETGRIVITHLFPLSGQLSCKRARSLYLQTIKIYHFYFVYLNGIKNSRKNFVTFNGNFDF